MSRESKRWFVRLASAVLLMGVGSAQGGAYLGPRELTEALGLGMCGCGLPEQAVDPVGEAWEPGATGHLIHSNGGLPWESWWGFHRARLLPPRSTSPQGRATEELAGTVVPTLLAALETEAVGAWALHDSAGLALARIVRAEPALRPTVRDPILAWFSGSFSGVPRAAVAIGLVGDPRDIPLLVDLATDGPGGRAIIQQPRVYPTMRTYAIYGLDAMAGQHTEPELRRSIVRAFKSALESTRPELVEFAIAGVIGMGRCPLPPRTPFVGEAEDRPLGLEDQIELLLSSVDPEGKTGWPRGVRAHVPLALARLCSSLLGESEEHAALRQQILRALSRTLRRLPEEGLSDLRFGAIAAAGVLGRAGLDPGDKALRDALGEVTRSGTDAEQPLAQLALAEILARPGDGERPTAGRGAWVQRWVAALGDGAPDERAWAVLNLGAHGRARLAQDERLNDDDLRRLRRIAAQENDPAVRAAYAVTFALLQDVASIHLVREWVHKARDRDAGVGACAEALGVLRDLAGQRGIETQLRLRLKRSQAPDRVALVGTALAIGGRSDDFARIVGMLTRPAKRGSESGLAEALGAFHAVADLAPLIDLVSGERYRQNDRAAAAAALGRLAVPAADAWSRGLRAAVPFPLRTPAQVNADGNGVLQFL
jgi:hypothetical protein